MRTRAQILERARIHVGHRETAPNDSTLIRAWLRRCGVPEPAAWCAAFASWCIESRELRAHELPAGGELEVAQAGALRLGRLFPETFSPQPADLAWFATNAKGNGHIGIVTATSHPDEVWVIEGNSANMVREVRRLRREVRFSSTRSERWSGGVVSKPDVPLVRVSYDGTR